MSLWLTFGLDCPFPQSRAMVANSSKRMEFSGYHPLRLEGLMGCKVGRGMWLPIPEDPGTQHRRGSWEPGRQGSLWLLSASTTYSGIILLWLSLTWLFRSSCQELVLLQAVLTPEGISAPKSIGSALYDALQASDPVFHCLPARSAP